MKISIAQPDLLPALTSVSRSVGVKANLPVLGNILLSAESNKLTLSATNLEIGIIKSISCEVIDPGDITIPAKTILEIIQSLGAVKVEVETIGDNMSISSGKFKASLNCIPSSEFPVIPLSSEKGITIKKEVIANIPSIIFAAAIDEGRPTLTGILTELEDSHLNFVATDGFRLAHQQVKLTELDSGTKIKVLIPKRTFEEVVRVIAEEGIEEIEMAASNSQNQIIFKIGSSTISSRLIEGPFPGWEKLIPTEHKTRLILDRSELVAAVKLASVFAKSESNIITFKLSEGKVVLQSQSKELGSQENEVDGQVEGEDVTIAYNARFLTDAIGASNASQLIMEFQGSLSATLIKPMGIEGLEYILMPVRQS